MNEKMEKRLEEAANRIYPVSEIYNDLAMEFVDVNGGLREAFQDGGKVGAEHGYKEAIEQAKEWLMNYFFFENSLMSASGCDLFLRRFEADMNKLWEEQK